MIMTAPTRWRRQRAHWMDLTESIHSHTHRHTHRAEESRAEAAPRERVSERTKEWARLDPNVRACACVCECVCVLYLAVQFTLATPIWATLAADAWQSGRCARVWLWLRQACVCVRLSVWLACLPHWPDWLAAGWQSWIEDAFTDCLLTADCPNTHTHTDTHTG